MAPIGFFLRPKGEHVLIHRCLTCGQERFNRIAGDDDFDLVLSLPEVESREAPRRRAADSALASCQGLAPESVDSVVEEREALS